MDDDEAATPQAWQENFETLLQTSAVDRNRTDTQSHVSTVPFEGDERLQIPVGTDDTLAHAIQNYWSVWSEQRDAVLERHAEAQQRADEFRKKQRKAPSASALSKLQRTDPAAFAAFDAEAQFVENGGPLGVEMMSFRENLGPIDLSEIATIAVATEVVLRGRPPVRVFWACVVQAAPAYQLAEHLEEVELVAIVAGEAHGITFSAIDVPAAKELEQTLNDTARPEDIRLAYTRFATQFWSWRQEVMPSTDVLVPTPGLFDGGPLGKQTFRHLHRAEQAYADKNFQLATDGGALIHRTYTKKRELDPIEVVIEPLENPQWLPPATVGDLKAKLERIGGSGPFTFAVAVALAVQHDRPTLELDDFIKFLGLDPRSTKERAECRATLWECLQLFAQTSAVGELQGHFRDRSGKLITRIERSPIIAITGTQYGPEMRFDKSEPPIAVSFTLGDFLYRHRGDQRLLAHLGDLRTLAAIPSGKASGQWARCIGQALLQIWREGAQHTEFATIGDDQHLTARGRNISRREIFDRIRPTPDPFEVLQGSNPARARKYWDDAIAELRLRDYVQLVGKSETKFARKGWQDAWLDEPLGLRPHRQNIVVIEGLKKVADGAKAFRKKRGRPRKSPEKNT